MAYDHGHIYISVNTIDIKILDSETFIGVELFMPDWRDIWKNYCGWSWQYYWAYEVDKGTHNTCSQAAIQIKGADMGCLGYQLCIWHQTVKTPN